MKCKICGRDIIEERLKYSTDGMGNVLCRACFISSNLAFAEGLEEGLDDDLDLVTA